MSDEFAEVLDRLAAWADVEQPAWPEYANAMREAARRLRTAMPAMPAVIDRVACPECGAQKGQPCWDAYVPLDGQSHIARWEALWALIRRVEAERQRPA
jgi:hypothetical protein